MSVGLSLPQLNAIACGAIGVNSAAGGAAGYNLTGDYMPDLITIACQLRNANVALGGSGAGSGGFDSVGNLMVYITCQAQGMATATGTGSAMPWEPYNMLQMWQAIDCALAQSITNTGGAARGYSNNTVYNLMEGAICLLAELAQSIGGSVVPPDNLFVSPQAANMLRLDWDPAPVVDSYSVYRSTVNGGPYTLLASGVIPESYEDFAVVDGTTYYYVVRAVVGAQSSGNSNQGSGVPIDDLQVFINSVLGFNPDRLFVYPKDTYSNVGGTVPANPGDDVMVWKDQSPNATSFIPNTGAASSAPPKMGAVSLLLNTPGFLQGFTQAYSNTGFDIFAVVVCTQEPTAVAAFDRILSFSAGANDYDGSNRFLLYSNPAPDYGLFWNGSQRDFTAKDLTDDFHTVGCLIKIGSNLSKAFFDGTTQAGNAANLTQFGITNFGAGFQATGADGNFSGQFKAVAVWTTAPSDGDITTILGLFRTYFGTP